MFEFRGSRVRIEVHSTEDAHFPTDDGMSLLAALRDDPEIEIRGRRALDIGCGSGLSSIALLTAGAAHVTALDLNVHAADVTRTNALINQVDPAKLTCITVDIAQFHHTGDFDLILANPPHFPHSPVHGADGRALYDKVIDRVDELLAPDGTLIIAHSSLTDVALTKRQMALRGYQCRTVEVLGMDIPLRAYAEQGEDLMRELEVLRGQGKAVFEGGRFSVHVLAFRRACPAA
jgi:release factor glutamine methyltransferase